MDLSDIYRTFHRKAIEYTFFSSIHGTFSERDNILGDNTSLYKLKRIEIIPSIFSKHNNMTRNQLQEENWEICKYAEIKQHATEQQMGQRRNQKKNLKIPRNK